MGINFFGTPCSWFPVDASIILMSSLYLKLSMLRANDIWLFLFYSTGPALLGLSKIMLVIKFYLSEWEHDKCRRSCQQIVLILRHQKLYCQYIISLISQGLTLCPQLIKVVKDGFVQLMKCSCSLTLISVIVLTFVVMKKRMWPNLEVFKEGSFTLFTLLIALSLINCFCKIRTLS